MTDPVVSVFDDILICEEDEDEIVAVIQGPPGVDGSGAARYTHTQNSASDTWVVNHNFGYRPVAVQVLSPGGAVVDAEVTHISDNQLTINFTEPYAGSATVL